MLFAIYNFAVYKTLLNLRETSTDAMALWKANLPLPSTMGMPERNKDGVERYSFVIKIYGSGKRIKTLRF